MQLSRQLWIDLYVETQPFSLYPRLDHIDQIIEHRSRMIVHWNDLHFPGLDFGEIQYIIDQAKKRRACRLDIVCIDQRIFFFALP